MKQQSSSVAILQRYMCDKVQRMRLSWLQLTNRNLIFQECRKSKQKTRQYQSVKSLGICALG